MHCKNAGGVAATQPRTHMLKICAPLWLTVPRLFLKNIFVFKKNACRHFFFVGLNWEGRVLYSRDRIHVFVGGRRKKKGSGESWVARVWGGERSVASFSHPSEEGRGLFVSCFFFLLLEETGLLGLLAHGLDVTVVVLQLLSEVGDRLRETLANRRPRLPAQLRLRLSDVRLALRRVVLRRSLELDLAGGLREFLDKLGELLHRVLVGVAHVHRRGDVTVHHRVDAVHQVVHELERPGLLARAVDGQRLALQGLDDEVRHDTAVVRVHARPERVEDAHHADVHVVLLLVGVHHRLAQPLGLVVAGARPDRVHVAPVRLGLRVHLRVAVHLRGAGEEDAGATGLSNLKHVAGALRVGQDGLHRVEHVVGRRRGRRHVVDLVNHELHLVSHVVVHDREVGVPEPLLHVLDAACEEVVHHDHVVPLEHQLVDEVRPDEAAAAGHENPLLLRRSELGCGREVLHRRLDALLRHGTLQLRQLLRQTLRRRVGGGLLRRAAVAPHDEAEQTRDHDRQKQRTAVHPSEHWLSYRCSLPCTLTLSDSLTNSVPSRRLLC
eukprot:Rhum_TRINITY_DN22999_c0_g1::Rhum_TRINITY_DN22999_c0_g1_i1::g.176756::m.176756